MNERHCACTAPNCARNRAPKPERTVADERADMVAWLREHWSLQGEDLAPLVASGKHIGAADRVAKGGGDGD